MENQKFYSILIQYIAPYIDHIDIIVGTGNILRSIFSNVSQASSNQSAAAPSASMGTALGATPG